MVYLDFVFKGDYMLCIRVSGGRSLVTLVGCISSIPSFALLETVGAFGMIRLHRSLLSSAITVVVLGCKSIAHLAAEINVNSASFVQMSRRPRIAAGTGLTALSRCWSVSNETTTTKQLSPTYWLRHSAVLSLRCNRMPFRHSQGIAGRATKVAAKARVVLTPWRAGHD